MGDRGYAKYKGKYLDLKKKYNELVKAHNLCTHKMSGGENTDELFNILSGGAKRTLKKPKTKSNQLKKHFFTDDSDISLGSSDTLSDTLTDSTLESD